MSTIINIVAIIILVITIIIAVSGIENLNNFCNGMDEIFNKARKDAEEYTKRLKENNNNGNINTEGELSSNQGSD